MLASASVSAPNVSTRYSNNVSIHSKQLSESRDEHRSTTSFISSVYADEKILDIIECCSAIRLINRSMVHHRIVVIVRVHVGVFSSLSVSVSLE